MVGGAAGLIEEVAASKISGEEDRYSHTDLWDFGPTLTARRKSSTCCVRSCKREQRAAGEGGCQLQKVDAILSKYRTKDGFETYDKLTDADRNALKGPITTLAEDLAQLRGITGLD